MTSCIWTPDFLRSTTIHYIFFHCLANRLCVCLEGSMSLCLSSSGPQSQDSQHRVTAIVMVVLWHIRFLPAVTTRKEPLAERVSASFKLYICSRLSVQTTWDAISPSPHAGICLLVLFVRKGLWFQMLKSQSLWMKMPSSILKRK